MEMQYISIKHGKVTLIAIFISIVLLVTSGNDTLSRRLPVSTPSHALPLS